MMKNMMIALLLTLNVFAMADSAETKGVAVPADKMKMYYVDEEIMKIIEHYSKLSGQKFVIDPMVRGKATILIQDPVSKEEAFNQLSLALAINGFAISKLGDTMMIKSARNIQRDLIEVGTEKPSIAPERMYTWIYTLKHIPVGSVNRDLRILTSKDGELAPNENTNQLIITDWVTNLNRIGDILQTIDKPADAKISKLVEQSKKEKSHEAKAPHKENSEKK